MRAQSKALKSQGTKDEAFDLGVLQGYWQLMTSIVSRMDIHEVDRHEYGLDGYDADTIWVPIQQAVKDRKSSAKDDAVPQL